jgi:hypothetical protein
VRAELDGTDTAEGSTTYFAISIAQ